MRRAVTLGSLTIGVYRTLHFLAVVIAISVMSAIRAAADVPVSSSPEILIRTDLGEIRVVIYSEQAPVTAANFLAYVDGARYKGATFYRTLAPGNQPNNPVKIEAVQGGLGMETQPGALPPIAHETTATSGLRHTDGTLSMARLKPGTASSEFFIAIGNQPELDFGGQRNPDGLGFAAFGRVVAGMDVVKRIQQQPAEGQMLTSPVHILEIERVQPPK